MGQKGQEPAPEFVHFFHGLQSKEDPNFGAEFVGRDGLHDVVVGTGLISADTFFDLGIRGHEDDLEVLERPLRPQHSAQVVPVDDGHHDVEENERRLQTLRGVKRRLSVGQRRDVVFIPKKLLDDDQIHGLVINCQDLGAQGHATDSWSVAITDSRCASVVSAPTLHTLRDFALSRGIDRLFGFSAPARGASRR